MVSTPAISPTAPAEADSIDSLREYELVPDLLRPVVKSGLKAGDNLRTTVLKWTTNVGLFVPIVLVAVPYFVLGVVFEAPRYTAFALAATLVQLLFLVLFAFFPRSFAPLSRLAVWMSVVTYSFGAGAWLGGPLRSGLIEVWGTFMLPYAFIYMARREAWLVLVSAGVALGAQLALAGHTGPMVVLPDFWLQLLATHNLVTIGLLTSLLLYMVRVERRVGMAEVRRAVGDVAGG